MEAMDGRLGSRSYLFGVLYYDPGVSVWIGDRKILLFEKCYMFFHSPPGFVQTILNRVSYAGETLQL